MIGTDSDTSWNKEVLLQIPVTGPMSVVLLYSNGSERLSIVKGRRRWRL